MSKIISLGVLTSLATFWATLIVYTPLLALAWVAIVVLGAIAGSKPWRSL